MTKLGTSEYRETSGLYFCDEPGVNCWVVYNLKMGEMACDYFCKTEDDAKALVALENNPVWCEGLDEDLVLVADFHDKVVYDANKLASVKAA